MTYVLRLYLNYLHLEFVVLLRACQYQVYIFATAFAFPSKWPTFPLLPCFDIFIFRTKFLGLSGKGQEKQLLFKLYCDKETITGLQ